MSSDRPGMKIVGISAPVHDFGEAPTIEVEVYLSSLGMYASEIVTITVGMDDIKRLEQATRFLLAEAERRQREWDNGNGIR